MNTTPLTAVHEASGARMTDFAGTWMPLQYAHGIAHEHLVVRERCGIFDVSHMAEIRVSGAGSLAFLRYALLNDAAKLKVGRAHYSMLPNDDGGLVDDVYLYRLSDTEWWIVANAANRSAALARLATLAAENEQVEVVDESDDVALMALQGPLAASILDRLSDVDVTTLRKNDTGTCQVAGVPVRYARTGYTGEDGFELFTTPHDAPFLWTTLCEAGAEPCGLGARDTLRLEAGYPLFGHELTESTDPRCTPFAWVVKDKPFAGRDRWGDADCGNRLVGLKIVGRGIARAGYAVLDEGGRPIGTVTSGAPSPLTRDVIAFAWIDVAHATVGTTVSVEIRGAAVEAHVSEIPFYTPEG